jgi:ribosomal protein L29
MRQAKKDLARALTVAQQRGIDVETEIRRQRRTNA